MELSPRSGGGGFPISPGLYHVGTLASDRLWATVILG